jgi:SAM-dependent methyltransferase
MLRARLRNDQDWKRLWFDTRPRFGVEALIADEYRGSERWTFVGWCDVCGRASAFECDWQHSDSIMPNFREKLVCEGCALNSRQRLVFVLLSEILDALEVTLPSRARRIYVYEQVTPLYAILKQKLHAEVVGSEYLGHDIAPGEQRDGVRHEDALHLSFEDESFDVVLSNDVYEHVPDIEQALREAQRVLRPGGSMLATIPFTFGEITTRRARLVEGRLEHLLAPEYHGNPLSPEGSLVFYDFGWDVLDSCRNAGFDEAFFVCAHSFFRGYLGDGFGLSLLAAKNARPRP